MTSATCQAIDSFALGLSDKGGNGLSPRDDIGALLIIERKEGESSELDFLANGVGEVNGVASVRRDVLNIVEYVTPLVAAGDECISVNDLTLKWIEDNFHNHECSVLEAMNLDRIDVLKVRLQMQLIGQKGPLTGMGAVFGQMMKREGPRSLYLGLSPALTRSVLYGGLRLGLYEPSKNFCEWVFGSANILVKITSGGFSGAVATALTNPTEVLKVRLQMNPSLGGGGAIRELCKISSEEGVKALWKGLGPAMTRAAALTASQLATYDEFKRVLIHWTPLEEGFHLHLISSAIAGIMSTFVTAPMDMIKTRLMLQRESTSVGSYKNGLHCAYKVMLTEGPLALYKGGFAIFSRLGPQTTITFLVCEKLRELAGLKAL
ncbi:hypothetical protein GIB67_034458 [Kingdonia uniflora]|uniref:Mitochondrial substrate carrier family protein ucpB n=1 Tax=Kingdonia uniflora TaxID=39325 RepID=A0A7J7PAZ7_9MAGN|nr:hypothetical protein GIB67_034458 [Kingdonia uniflora]